MTLPYKNLQLIQFMRGIAALLVVFYHVSCNLNDVLHVRFLFDAFKFGGAGVDIFFVLSGFIITYTSSKYIGESNKLPNFIKRRFVRIYPNYWIIISLFLMLQLLLPSFYKTKFPLSPSTFLSTYFLMPGHIMLNGVSWTLAFELFFYLLFSLAFIIPNKKLSFGIAMGFALTIITAHIAGLSESNNATSFVLSPMNLEFIMGICAAIVVLLIPVKTSGYLITLGACLFIINGELSNLNSFPFNSAFNRVIYFGIPAMLIIIGIVKYELSRNITIHSYFLLLGEASYSLYLIHLPIVAASAKILHLFHFSNTLLLNFIFLLLVIFICWISILFYKFIENPIIKNINSFRRIKVANEI